MFDLSPEINALIADSSSLKDGEVLGLIENELVLWNEDDLIPYLCGESLEDFGVHCLFDYELSRVGVSVRQWRSAVHHFEESKHAH